MTKRRLAAVAILLVLASTGPGSAAGRPSGAPLSPVNTGDTGDPVSDKAGANVVDIPDMAIGGPRALDVTKELPSTAPQAAPQVSPRPMSSPGVAPPQ